MSETFEQRCAAAVQAVPHDDNCASELASARECDCTREHRIGLGIAALVRYWADNHLGSEFHTAATDSQRSALVAFTEAAK